MAKINSNYQKLQAGYLFPEIGKRVRAYAAENPDAKIIRLGIGDVVLPLPEPVYPVYVDTNVMAGRTGPFEGGRYGKLVYMPTTAENGFDPELPKGKVDLIYLCSPNNPTGAVMSRASLEKWVAYAKANEAII